MGGMEGEEKRRRWGRERDRRGMEGKVVMSMQLQMSPLHDWLRQALAVYTCTARCRPNGLITFTNAVLSWTKICNG